MLNKIKTYIAHFMALLTPQNYVDIINNVYSSDELDEGIRRKFGFDRKK